MESLCPCDQKKNRKTQANKIHQKTVLFVTFFGPFNYFQTVI